MNRSAFVDRYIKDWMIGCEIGGSAHNDFGLPNCINCDRYGGNDTIYKKAEIDLCGEAKKVDVVAEMTNLPFADKSFDYCFSSHVIEHVYDTIAGIKEQIRVSRLYVVAIIPEKTRTFDKKRPITPPAELLQRHLQHDTSPMSDIDTHHSVFTLASFLELCGIIGVEVLESIDPDDRVGNGFGVILDANIQI